MAPINIINLALLSYLIAVLTNGIILAVKHQKNRIYRRFVLVMLSFWDMIMIGIFVKFNMDGLVLNINYGIMNSQIILMGIPCFFTLIAYPTMAINSKFMKFENWVRLSLPIISLVVIYVAYCLLSGVSPFYQYGSYAELFANITTVVVMLRILMVAVLLFYIVFMVISIWNIAPKYNLYIKENLSNADYNVDWARWLVIYMSFVFVGYFALLFTSSVYVNTYYLVAVICLFSYLVDRSVFHKSIDEYDMFEVRWDTKAGYYVADPLKHNGRVVLAPKSDKQVLDDISAWLNRYKVYQRLDFTTQDILADFPDLTGESLVQIFKSQGESFQSFVRRFRIEKACELIKENPEGIDQKRLSSLVGFSHYSSFSRAFTAVIGKNPSEYIKSLK